MLQRSGHKDKRILQFSFVSHILSCLFSFACPSFSYISLLSWKIIKFHIIHFHNTCNNIWAESELHKGMAFNGHQYLIYFGVLNFIISSFVPIMAASVTPTTLVDRTSLNRSSFPKGFIFGTASSSYQVRFVKFCML